MSKSTSTLFTLLLILGLGFNSQAKAQEWEELGDSPFSQRHHAIGFSANGFGYIVSGSQTKDVWRYTPETDGWEQLDDYSDIFRGFSIGAMHGDDGYFGFGFTFGGPFTGRAKDLWKFDSETESFEELAECPCERRTHPAFVVFEDKIYMGLGGGEFGNLGDWWEYDIPTDTWSERASFIGSNRHHPYQFVIGDYVYVGSGHFSDWFRYHPASNTWTQIASHPSFTRVAGIQFAYEGKGYTLSGVADYDNQDHIPMPTGEFWEYDPELDEWNELPPHPGLSRWASASFIINGWLYMIAGETYDGNNATYRYQLSEPDITSVEENNADTQLDLYPMPFDNQLVLPSDRVWQGGNLYDISGALVRRLEVQSNLLSIPGLTSGMYLIELWDGKERFFQKVNKR